MRYDSNGVRFLFVFVFVFVGVPDNTLVPLAVGLGASSR